MGGTKSKEAKNNAIVKELLQKALGKNVVLPEWAIQNSLFTVKDLQNALKGAGVESSNLIVGIDFTSSNRTQGAKSFNNWNLHKICDASENIKNPYEASLEIIGRTLSAYDDDGSIPMYSFGDTSTRHKSVALMGGANCNGLDAAIKAYRKSVPKLNMSGPTSFAPLINEAIEVVRQSGGQFHILLIIGDGQVSEECTEDTISAIVRASKFALSIIMIGVGDGPWDAMREFDNSLPSRSFDNFQFVPFDPFFELMMGKTSGISREQIEAAFGLAVLQEVPAQYKQIKQLGLLEPDADTKGAGAAKRKADDTDEDASKRSRT